VMGDSDHLDQKRLVSYRSNSPDHIYVLNTIYSNDDADDTITIFIFHEKPLENAH